MLEHRFIYLDNAATTVALPQVTAAVTDALTRTFGNPSSAHPKGMEAEKGMREARAIVAAAVGAKPGEIVFTSGGTEGNNLAILGAARARRGRGAHLVTSTIEHSSVLEAMKRLEQEGFAVTYLPVDETGVVRYDDLAAAIRDDTILVSLALVNNEIGSINPIATFTRALSATYPRLLWHVDAVQGVAKVPVDVRELGVDLLTMSGHKVHAPKGIGALFVREGVNLHPLLHGGGQERAIRPGTENLPGILGLAAALAELMVDLEERAARLREFRAFLIQRLSAIESSRLNGRADKQAAPHIVNFSFAGLSGEVLARLLGAKGVYVSTGSACSAKRRAGSHVLQAMRLPDWALQGSIRISLSALTSRAEVEEAAEIIAESVAELRRKGGRRAL